MRKKTLFIKYLCLAGRNKISRSGTIVKILNKSVDVLILLSKKAKISNGKNQWNKRSKISPQNIGLPSISLGIACFNPIALRIVGIISTILISFFLVKKVLVIKIPFDSGCSGQ